MPEKTFKPAQAYSDKPRQQIMLNAVDSNKIGAVGYDPDTQTLAVQFKRGAGAIYHYPNVTPEQHAAFIGAESLGKHFGEHLQALPFEKFAAETEQASA